MYHHSFMSLKMVNVFYCNRSPFACQLCTWKLLCYETSQSYRSRRIIVYFTLYLFILLQPLTLALKPSACAHMNVCYFCFDDTFPLFQFTVPLPTPVTSPSRVLVGPVLCLGPALDTWVVEPSTSSPPAGWPTPWPELQGMVPQSTGRFANKCFQ